MITDEQPPPNLPEVAGRMECSIANLEHRARMALYFEQQRPAPDNALISILCDCIRMGREYAAAMQVERIHTAQPDQEGK